MVTTVTGSGGGATVGTTAKGAAGLDAATNLGLRGVRGSNGKGGPGDGGPGGGAEQPGTWTPDHYRIGMLAGIASILMMFTALASAYVVRSGLPGSFDWRGMNVPSFVWLSTALIILSSLTIGRAQKALRRGEESVYGRWLALTLLLGFGFLAAQLLAWRQLVAAGVYVASNPHSSFFYVLTGLHGIHLLGGILALGYLLVYARRGAQGAGAARFEVKRRALTDVVAIYWHFMDGLWVFLFLLLFLWR